MLAPQMNVRVLVLKHWRWAATVPMIVGASLAASAPAVSSGRGGFVQVGSKLAGKVPGGEFGLTVALSGDARTALVGDPSGDSDSNGAAVVLVRAGAGWRRQARLVGTAHAWFGSQVALSSNGDTALISEPTGLGHVWVYTRSGSKWSRQAKLTGKGEQVDSEFGNAVALSEDGNTAIVGDELDHHDTGATWIFTRTGSTWKQSARFNGRAKEDYYGQAAAISADGKTALVGSPGAHDFAGTATLYLRSGATWKQGPVLTRRHGPPGGGFGSAVALSGDGRTAVIVGLDLARPSTATVFTRSGSSWTQTRLPNRTSDTANFGGSLALSGTGKTVLIAADNAGNGRGSIDVYTRSAAGWSLATTPLVAHGETGKGRFGESVSLSTDDRTALIGAGDDADKTGAAWIFAVSP